MGTVVQQGGLVLDNSLLNSPTLDIDNASGGVWSIPEDSSITETGPSLSTFTNAGTLSKVGGTGTFSILARFDNAGGTINVEAGTISLVGYLVVASNGNADDFTAEGGTFNVATGAQLVL